MKKSNLATKLFIFIAMISIGLSGLSCTAARQVLDFANQVNATKVDSIPKDTIFYTATVEEWDTLRHTVEVWDTNYHEVLLDSTTSIIGSTGQLLITDGVWRDVDKFTQVKKTNTGYQFKTITPRKDTVFKDRVITKTITKYVPSGCKNCPAPGSKGIWTILAIIGAAISSFANKKSSSNDDETA